jgi:pimeloyl-ACP methyl ester carboxylesterase
MAYNGRAMEPRIQYAQTKDGVSIAYWTIGEGTPVVYMPSLPWSHIQQEWEIPGLRRWYERLAERRKLIRYDNRGSGFSEREVSDHSIEAHILDLQAVVDRLGLEKFSLVASLHAGSVAVTYVARRPERVSRLILFCTYARTSDYFRVSLQVQAVPRRPLPHFVRWTFPRY